MEYKEVLFLMPLATNGVPTATHNRWGTRSLVSMAPSNEWSTYNYCSNSPLQRMQYKEVFVSLVPCNNGVHTTIAPIAPCNEWSTKTICFYSPLHRPSIREVRLVRQVNSSGEEKMIYSFISRFTMRVIYIKSKLLLVCI